MFLKEVLHSNLFDWTQKTAKLVPEIGEFLVPWLESDEQTKLFLTCLNFTALRFTIPEHI